MRVRAWVRTAWTIIIEVRTQQLPFLAGSFAFHLFLSLVPAVLLVWIVAATVAGDQITAQLIGWTGRYLSVSGQTIVVQAVETARHRTSGSLLGLAVLVWSVLRIFWGLDIVFCRLYGAPDGKSLTHQIRDGCVGILAIAVSLTAMVVVSAVFTVLPSLPLSWVGPSILLLLGLTIVFVPLYYVYPPVPITVREILPGAAVAAVGWTLLQGLFKLYVAFTPITDIYGVVGGVILVLLWLYAGTLLLLVGIVVNVVLAKRVTTTDEPIPGKRLLQRIRALLNRIEE